MSAAPCSLGPEKERIAGFVPLFAESEIHLNPGEFYFGGGRTRVRTLLGSCVSIAMWHPRRCIGGMCHYMLPSRGLAAAETLDGKYGDEAITLFLRALQREGSAPRDYIVKLFGGGNMFPLQIQRHACGHEDCPPEDRQQCIDVACRNIETARTLLARHGFNIAVQHVGGIGHRQLVFELWSGDVWLRHGGTGTAP